MSNVVKKSLLTQIELLPIKKGKKRKALYKCECGNTTEAFVDNVRRLHTVSCGCYQKANPYKTHGLRRHPLYRIWADIKTRCTNPNRIGDHLYHGKGVKMCDEWLNNPESFIKWALSKGWERGKQIDKDRKAREAGIEPLLYSPDWCLVLTAKENHNEKSNNKKIEYNGVVKNIMQWGEFYGVSKAKFWYRMRACNFDMYAYVKKWGNKT